MLRTVTALLSAFALISAAAPANAQQAGTLISADPVVETPNGMQAWKVRYWTSTADNRPREVTGMVIAPREAQPAAPRKVIAWTHGAWGVAERCAPSLNPAFLTISPALGQMVSRGYTVVAPDYPGLGSSGVHPFLVGQDTARSVLDGIRAARAIPGAYAGNRVAIWGESQGGHAALWTAQQADRYAPDLTVVGVAAAAPPTDLAANLSQGSNASVRAMMTAFAAYSWSQHYQVPLTTLGRKPIQDIITRLAQNNCVDLSGKPKIGTAIGVLLLQRQLRRVDMTTTAPWSGFARDNSVRPANFPMPVMIAQSPADVLVAPAVTRAFARRLCRTPTRVRYLDIPGGKHENSAADTSATTLEWIADRFAGQRAPSDCRRI